MSWTLIEHQALTSSAASVTLGSGGTIPQTYKTLKLVMSTRSNAPSTDTSSIRIQLNGSGSTFTVRGLYGTGSATGSYTETNYLAEQPATLTTSSTFGSIAVDFPNYAGSTNKPFSVDNVAENNGTNARLDFVAGLWSTTSAVTSITILNVSTHNFVQYSTFTLYGLA